VRREQSGVMPIRAGETGGTVMDLVAADPRGGYRVLADVVTSGGSDTLDGGHGDGGGARTRCTAGGGDEGWEVWRSLPR
jgi:hypothetical protein